MGDLPWADTQVWRLLGCLGICLKWSEDLGDGVRLIQSESTQKIHRDSPQPSLQDPPDGWPGTPRG